MLGVTSKIARIAWGGSTSEGARESIFHKGKIARVAWGASAKRGGERALSTRNRLSTLANPPRNPTQKGETAALAIEHPPALVRAHLHPCETKGIHLVVRIGVLPLPIQLPERFRPGSLCIGLVGIFQEFSNNKRVSKKRNSGSTQHAHDIRIGMVMWETSGQS